MTIFIVDIHWDFEGSRRVGIFTDLSRAMQAALIAATHSDFALIEEIGTTDGKLYNRTYSSEDGWVASNKYYLEESTNEVVETD
jgi:hypothetical protein